MTEGNYKLDWEKEICLLVDKAAERPEGRYEICEEIIEIVEDLVVAAYIKGRGGVKGLVK